MIHPEDWRLEDLFEGDGRWAELVGEWRMDVIARADKYLAELDPCLLAPRNHLVILSEEREPLRTVVD